MVQGAHRWTRSTSARYLHNNAAQDVFDGAESPLNLTDPFGEPCLGIGLLDWDQAGQALVPAGGVAEPEGLEARRRSIGLPPMEWRRPPQPDEPPPADPAARQRESDEWGRRAGWRGPGTGS